MPVKHMTEEHRALLAEKCSEAEDPQMPDLPTMPLLATAGGNTAANITPLPSHEQAVAENQSKLVVGASKGKKSGVTPSPMPPKGSSKQAAKKAAAPKIDPKLKALYDKWQAEAEKMGGASIIVDTNAAKKVVFDKLHDLFSPVNITQLFAKLKGVVPGPILRKCLDTMVDKANDNPFADDSDDEDEKPSKKKSASQKSTDEYAGSIRVKEGRNANTTLYYVDHTKLQNNGNGLLPEDRNELFSNLEKSKQELAVLGQKHEQICSDTAQLLSEPKNEELENELQELTNKMEVVDNGLEEARAHASSKFVSCFALFLSRSVFAYHNLRANPFHSFPLIDAKHAKQLKGRIDKMACEWRKRKRMCIEFIQNMEEATDGTISVSRSSYCSYYRFAQILTIHFPPDEKMPERRRPH